MSREEAQLQEVLQRYLQPGEVPVASLLGFHAGMVAAQLWTLRCGVAAYLLLWAVGPEGWRTGGGVALLAVLLSTLVPAALLLRTRYLLAATSRRMLLLRLPAGLRWFAPEKPSEVREWPADSPPRLEATFGRRHGVVRVLNSGRPLVLRVEYSVFEDPGSGKAQIERLLQAAHSA